MKTFMKQMPIKSLVPMIMVGAWMATPAALATDSVGRSGDGTGIQIMNVAVSGSGCPASSVRVTIDNNRLVLAHAPLQAEAGPGVDLKSGRSLCQVMATLIPPAGTVVEVTDPSLDGYAKLDSGVTATVKSSLYFQGEARTVSFQNTLTGPRTVDARFILKAEGQSVLAPACGTVKPLIVQTQIRVSNRAQPSRRGIVTLDGSQVYKIKVKKCGS